MSDFNNTDQKPKVVSIFSGCGGLDLGFHMEGYELFGQMIFQNGQYSHIKNISEKLYD